MRNRAYGHLFGNGSGCVNRRGDRYLLKRKLPSAGRVCAAPVPIPLGLSHLDGRRTVSERRRQTCWSGQALGFGLELREVAAGCAQVLG